MLIDLLMKPNHITCPRTDNGGEHFSPEYRRRIANRLGACKKQLRHLNECAKYH